MSPPYSIVNQWYEPLVRLHPKASLQAAITVCKDYRAHIDTHAQIHGDNIDLDCADGLSPEERDIIEEAGL